jgi:16S rRNA C1402 (ribose-2'-O) methylase RsmI
MRRRILAVNKKTSTKVRAKARVKQDLTKSPTQLRAETKAPKRKDLTKRQWERYGELIRILRNNKTKYARELSLSEAENMYMQMKLDEMKRIKTKYAGIV